MRSIFFFLSSVSIEVTDRNFRFGRSEGESGCSPCGLPQKQIPPFARNDTGSLRPCATEWGCAHPNWARNVPLFGPEDKLLPGGSHQLHNAQFLAPLFVGSARNRDSIAWLQGVPVPAGAVESLRRGRESRPFFDVATLVPHFHFEKELPMRIGKLELGYGACQGDRMLPVVRCRRVMRNERVRRPREERQTRSTKPTDYVSLW